MDIAKFGRGKTIVSGGHLTGKTTFTQNIVRSLPKEQRAAILYFKEDDCR